ncbi:MAG TPA: DMT family transporter [Chlamydiales bacterium]|jgi:drug/metabolite transporter (DMT)-like permease|nr:DMT family transporter [Chlamydiales bacterium]
MNTASSEHRLLPGVSIALLAYFCLSCAASLVWNFQERFPTIQIIFIQNVVSFFCILPIALRNGWEKLRTNELPTHLMRDLFGVTSYFLYFLAIRYLNLLDAAILNNTAPFFVPLFWWMWMYERVEKHVWWSIIIGFIGVAIILNPSKEIFQFGFVFGFFAGIASAIAVIAIRLLSIKREPISRTLFYYFSISAILSFPFAWAAWVPPNGNEWFLIIGIGVFTAGGQMFLTLAYRYGTAAFLSPLCYSAVIFNGLSSTLIFGMPMTWRSYVGTSLIIIGGTLTYLWKRKPQSIKETFVRTDTKKPPPI